MVIGGRIKLLQLPYPIDGVHVNFELECDIKNVTHRILGKEWWNGLTLFNYAQSSMHQWIWNTGKNVFKKIESFIIRVKLWVKAVHVKNTNNWCSAQDSREYGIIPSKLDTSQ